MRMMVIYETMETLLIHFEGLARVKEEFMEI